MSEELRMKVLGVIAGALEPIKPDEIAAHITLKHEDKQKIYNTLFTLRQDELAIADASRAHSVTAKGLDVLAKRQGAGRLVAVATSSARRALDTKQGTSKTPRLTVVEGKTKPSFRVQQALTESVKSAQNALDEYLMSVGDAAIIEPLQRTRDEARLALDAYDRACKPGAK